MIAATTRTLNKNHLTDDEFREKKTNTSLRENFPMKMFIGENNRSTDAVRFAFLVQTLFKVSYCCLS